MLIYSIIPFVDAKIQVYKNREPNFILYCKIIEI